MAIFYPDILQHNNPTKPLINITEIQGTAYPLGNLSETGSIPSDKRQIGQIIYVSGSSMYYSYYGQTTSSGDWNNSANWKTFATLSGSFTGSFSGSYVGDLLGTSSYSISSSQAQNSINAVNAIQSLFSISASHAVNALTSSYSISSSQAINSEYSISSSRALNADSASYIYPLTQDVLINGNLVVTNSITAQTLNVQTITSSIIYSSGSNTFGNNVNNVQSFTGSLRVSGSSPHYIIGGNVGINTPNPQWPLDVVGEAIANHRFGGNPQLALFRAEGSLSSPTIVTDSGSYIGEIGSYAYDGSAYQNAGFIRFTLDGVGAVGSYPGDIQFWTTPSGSVTSIQRVTINNEGNTGFGIGIPAAKLHVSGNILANSITGSIYTDYINVVTLYNTSSYNAINAINSSSENILNIKTDGTTNLGNQTTFNSKINLNAYDTNLGSNGWTTLWFYGNAAGDLSFNKITGSIPLDNTSILNSRRWIMSRRDTETGSNVGSNFYWQSRTDTGQPLRTNLFINRSSGFWGINGETSPSAVFTIKGSGSTSSTYAFWVKNSSNVRTFAVDDAGNLYTLGSISGSSVAAAGSDGQIQFNNLGSLGANSNFVWDNGNNRLNISGSVNINNSSSIASIITGTTYLDSVLTVGVTSAASLYPSDKHFARLSVRNDVSNTYAFLQSYSVPSGSFMPFKIEGKPTIFHNGSFDNAYFDNVGNFGVGNFGMWLGGTPLANHPSRFYVKGSGISDATYTAQFHNSTGTSNSLIIRDDGIVGIGTTSLGTSSKLIVAGSGLFTDGNLDPGDGTPVGVRIGYNIGADYGFVQSMQTGVAYKNLILQLHGGNVGIGNATPGHPLAIQRNQDADTLVQIINNATGSYSRSGIALGEVFGSYSGLISYVNSGANFGAGNELFAPNSLNISTNAAASGGITINPYSGPIILGTGGFSSAHERMRITSAGNVGIGVTSLNYKLEVGSVSTPNVTNTLFLGNGSISTAWTVGSKLSFGFSSAISNDDYTARIIGYTNAGVDYASRLFLQTHNATSGIWNSGVMLDEFGNVGINTNNPQSLLHVAGTTDWQGTIRVDSNGTSYASYGWYSNGTKKWSLYSNDISGVDTLNFSNASGSISLTLTQNGNVLIGSTTDSGYKLQVTGDIKATNKLISDNGSFVGIVDLGQIVSMTSNFSSYGNLTFNLHNGSGYSDILKIQGDGKIGIGTNNPADTVYISGSASWIGLGLKTSDPSGRGNIYAHNDLGKGAFVQAYGSAYASTLGGITASNAVSFMGGTNPSFVFFGVSSLACPIYFGYGAHSLPAMAITIDNKVAIGSISPSASLDVRSSLNNATLPLNLADDGRLAALFGNVGTNTMLGIGANNSAQVYLQVRSRLANGSSYPLLINPLGGNVGIYTDNPLEKLHVNGNVLISSSLYINQTSGSLNSGSINLFTYSTGSYTSTFYNYIITSGSNCRAGQLMTAWNGSEIRYTDTSTTDIGDTSLISFTASLSSNNVIISSTFPTAGWSVKTLINLL